MTLAEILSLSLLAFALGAPVCSAQDSAPPPPARQAVASSSSAQTSAAQDQGSTAPKKASSASTQSKTHPANKGQKKTTANLNCPPAGASGRSAKRSGSNASHNATSTHAGNSSKGSGGDASKAQAPANCPPTITVIRNGGSKEPSIELLGGARGQQASNEKTTTDQLLAATKENLDKVSGKNLSSSQQAMITQIQQFISESRESVAAGGVPEYVRDPLFPW